MGFPLCTPRGGETRYGGGRENRRSRRSFLLQEDVCSGSTEAKPEEFHSRWVAEGATVAARPDLRSWGRVDSRAHRTANVTEGKVDSKEKSRGRRSRLSFPSLELVALLPPRLHLRSPGCCGRVVQATGATYCSAWDFHPPARHCPGVGGLLRVTPLADPDDGVTMNRHSFDFLPLPREGKGLMKPRQGCNPAVRQPPITSPMRSSHRGRMIQHPYASI